MLWFAVWTTLVVATLVGAAVLGLRLWRSGKALLAQMQETSAVMDRLQARVDELEAAGEEPAAWRPALLADDVDRDRWRAARAGNLAARHARRDARRARAHARWHDLLGGS